MNHRQRQSLAQFTRFALVGVTNTFITLIIIFVCKGLLHLNPWLSNALGYVGGFINSFVLNKIWVFRSSNKVLGEALRFCLGFVVCYGLQLLATWLLTTHTPIGALTWQLPGFVLSGYALATLIGMVVYTLANFFFNRIVTFRAKN